MLYIEQLRKIVKEGNEFQCVHRIERDGRGWTVNHEVGRFLDHNKKNEWIAVFEKYEIPFRWLIGEGYGLVGDRKEIEYLVSKLDLTFFHQYCKGYSLI